MYIGTRDRDRDRDRDALEVVWRPRDDWASRKEPNLYVFIRNKEKGFKKGV